jgi:predicted Ser/Thr protein kinase
MLYPAVNVAGSARVSSKGTLVPPYHGGHDDLFDGNTFRRALKRLPSDSFHVIDLRHRLRMPINDVAIRIGVPNQAARKLYIRALAALAQELAEATANQGPCRPIPPLWLEACRQVIARGPAALKMGPRDVESGLFPYFENALRCLKWMAAYWPLPPERQSIPRGRPEHCADADVHFPRIDGFQIAESIGGGGQGVVYRAWHKRLECWVALKLLDMTGTRDPEDLRRLRQEARIAAAITENGILPIRDVIDLGNKLVLVMPYVESHNLAQIANQRWKVLHGHSLKEVPHPWAALNQRDYTERVLLLFDKVLESLLRLHRRGVLHGDLKPANILVDKNEDCWLIDFGLASQRRADSSTYPALAGGTQGFMSPEHWSGATDIDERADLFSIGATIYQTLTLELPYGSSRLTPDQIPVKLRPEQKRFLPRFMDLVIQKSLQPDRSRRYQSIHDFRKDWQRVRNRRPPSVRQTGQIFRRVYSLCRFL